MTRLVDPSSKAIAAVKLAPFWNSERASATAALEQDELAAPSRVATASDRGESSGKRRLSWVFETTTCTTAERANPRIRAQRISQVIAKEIDNVCRIASSKVIGKA
jgi:hypothetical protein